MIMTHKKEEQNLQELDLSWESDLCFPRSPECSKIH